MPFALMIAGLAIAFGSFLLGAHNMANTVESLSSQRFITGFKKHLLVMVGMALGGTLFVAGAIWGVLMLASYGA